MSDESDRFDEVTGGEWPPPSIPKLEVAPTEWLLPSLDYGLTWEEWQVQRAIAAYDRLDGYLEDRRAARLRQSARPPSPRQPRFGTEWEAYLHNRRQAHHGRTTLSPE